MVEFGGNNPGKNESPEEFNHRTSLKYNTFVLNDACNHRIVFKYSINVLHDACKVVDLFAM